MKEEKETQSTERERREFLRKSVYAAYATPVITGLLVEKASAANSWNPGQGRITTSRIKPPKTLLSAKPNGRPPSLFTDGPDIGILSSKNPVKK